MLGYLSEQTKSPISDLRYRLDRDDLSKMLLELENDCFDISQWNYAMSYIFKEELSFETVEQAKSWLQALQRTSRSAM